ncbi:toll/interleukin-1 receptor domain-containing protein [Planomicrobium okeanokoites]|uniref:toll/interleukin-1 receptor domain-containing protein n=1 Tax=Planomicrobium okeanokoites TaxID=244 RepID=UPI00248F8981|nr:toll/interleukin-1 receptor domain-containing protein [Planomicrobium okeanokoites]
MDTHKTAAISYSHDSADYIQWIHDLTNDLRKRGVDAKTDRMETENQTVHFKQLMNSLMLDKDFVIVMLTEPYARKAEGFQGGAGYEGQIISEMTQREPERLIFCLVGENADRSIPHNLYGYAYIDFRDQKQYEENVQKIVDRIYKTKKLHIEPLGANPVSEVKNDLQEYKEEEKHDVNQEEKILTNTFGETSIWSNLQTPIRMPTDLEKARFLKTSFVKLVGYMDSLLKYLKEKNPYLEYDKTEQQPNDFQFTVYKEGNTVTGVRMWLDHGFGSESIALSYGPRQSYSSGMNEIIRVNVDKQGELELELTLRSLGMRNDQRPKTPKEIAEFVWNEHMKYAVE